MSALSDGSTVVLYTEDMDKNDWSFKRLYNSETVASKRKAPLQDFH